MVARELPASPPPLKKRAEETDTKPVPAIDEETRSLVTLYTKRLQQICCEIYKTKNQLNPSYINDILETRTSRYPSRKPNDLYVPSANQKTFGLNSFRVEGPKIWNTLPEDVKTAKSLLDFKSKIKNVKLPSCRCERNCIEERELHAVGTYNAFPP